MAAIAATVAAAAVAVAGKQRQQMGGAGRALGKPVNGKERHQRNATRIRGAAAEHVPKVRRRRGSRGRQGA